MYAASSREALDGARVELETILRGADATTVGTELLTVADTVGADRTLRITLADSATAPDHRAAFADKVLQGKVADATRTIVASTAARSWSSDAELVSGLRQLGREALLLAAKAGDKADTVEDELFRLARVIKGDNALEQALSDRSRSTADRTALLRTLIDGKVDAITERLAVDAVATSAELPGDAIDELSQLAAASNGRKVAYVTSAGELSSEQRSKLASQLSEIYAAPVTLHVDIDPELLGGVVVRVGDERIDGSIAGKIATLRRGLR
ncbi:F0F1 ATP synthase subunit delta [Gordonia phthalatica]|uniref:ATP synthase subunit delta n=1 Tax=Gordonia phthalatica TaxID=1136941 RepID=A0A0N9NAD3_9ACTN|nr:F0F1 ATP synthase subunit delta [Gordonia phthalatica]ALG84333.1 ATP F0F1 synthase subunit delta [Gordonia phthalatica]